MAWRLLLILLVGLVGGASLHAQLPYRLSLAYDTELPDEKGLRDLLTIPQAYAQRGERTQAVKNLVNTLREAGFLAASLDSITGDTAFSMTAYLHVGRSYRWAQLGRGNVEDQILNRTGFRDRLYYNRPLNVRQVNRLFRQIITYCENHGYPFASIRLDSVEFDGEAMRAVLQLTKNREFRIDSIQVKGDAKIGVKYLSNYLGIKAGSLYDQSRLDRISTR
ncbi:MAG: hypothetical protein AAGB22_15750, partial [Bacteroidota bacterium]